MTFKQAFALLTGIVALSVAPMAQAIKANPRALMIHKTERHDVEAVLAAVTGLTAYTEKNHDNNENTVQLYWQDNATNEEQYIIERCKVKFRGYITVCNFHPVSNVAADSTTFKDSPGQGSFKYRVRALNINTSSAYSNEVRI
jgi:hypothetical protein